MAIRTRVPHVLFLAALLSLAWLFVSPVVHFMREELREPVAQIRIAQEGTEKRATSVDEAIIWLRDQAIMRGYEAVEETDRGFWTRGATTWRASRTGSGTSCSVPSPCSLKTSMCDGGSCAYARAPGDTIVLDDDTYTTTGINLSKMWGGGTSSAQITYTSETPYGVIFDCKLPLAVNDADAKCIDPFGSVKWTTLRGIRFINTSTVSRLGSGGQDHPDERRTSINMFGEGNKVVAISISGATMGMSGVGAPTPAGADNGFRDFDFVLAYYNGFHAPDRGHGHGGYFQGYNTVTDTGDRSYMRDLIAWRNGHSGMQIYTEGGEVGRWSILDSVFFQNGVGTSGGWLTSINRTDASLGAGGGATCDPANSKMLRDLVIERMQTYNPLVAEGVKLGYSKGVHNPIFINSFIVGRGTGSDAMTALPQGAGVCGTVNVSGNTFYGDVAGMTCDEYGDNDCFTPAQVPTTGTRITYRDLSHIYSGWGYATVYNWGSAATVNLALGSMGAFAGMNYEIYTNNDPHGAPIKTGTWNSGTVSVNTSGFTVEAPSGDWPTPPETGPIFNVYFLREGSGGAATPTPTNTASPTLTSTPTRTNTNTPSLTPTRTRTPTNTPSQSPTAPAATATHTPTLTASNTPTVTPTPAVFLPGGFEAEACTITTAPMEATADAAASGGFYVSSAVGDLANPIDGASGILTCSFDAPTTARYRVWVLSSSPSATEDSMYAVIDEGTLDAAPTASTHIYDMGEGLECGTGFADDWRGQGYVWATLKDRSHNCNGTTTIPGYERSETAGGAVGIDLTAGTHTIKFYGREAGARLDRIHVTSDFSYDPNIVPTPTPTAVPPGNPVGRRHYHACNGRFAWHTHPPPFYSRPCPWRRR